jgi:hypothetical protein
MFPALLVVLLLLFAATPATAPPEFGLVAAAAPPEFGWPVDSHRVTRRFDPPPAPWLPGHRGVDLAAPPSAVVRAAGPGVVVFTGRVAGRGVVSVAHPGGLRTTYEPLTPSVATGDRVTTGAEIGRLTSGHAGCPEAACLHWGLRRGDLYLDPLALLGLGRVRLLPLGEVLASVSGSPLNARPASVSGGPLSALPASVAGGPLSALPTSGSGGPLSDSPQPASIRGDARRAFRTPQPGYRPAHRAGAGRGHPRRSRPPPWPASPRSATAGRGPPAGS